MNEKNDSVGLVIVGCRIRRLEPMSTDGMRMAYMDCGAEIALPKGAEPVLNGLVTCPMCREI